MTYEKASNIIADKVYVFITTNNRNPSVIIVNPILFELLKRSLFFPHIPTEILRFQGVEVIRSIDLKTDEVRVY